MSTFLKDSWKNCVDASLTKDALITSSRAFRLPADESGGNSSDEEAAPT
jgi:hypothetical protein